MTRVKAADGNGKVFRFGTFTNKLKAQAVADFARPRSGLQVRSAAPGAHQVRSAALVVPHQAQLQALTRPGLQLQSLTRSSSSPSPGPAPGAHRSAAPVPHQVRSELQALPPGPPSSLQVPPGPHQVQLQPLTRSARPSPGPPGPPQTLNMYRTCV